MIDWSKLDVASQTALVRNYPADELWAFWGQVIGERSEIDGRLLAALSGRLIRDKKEHTGKWLAADSPWRNSLPGKLLLAAVSAEEGKHQEVVDWLTDVVSEFGPWRTEAFLARARAYRALGAYQLALADLKEAAKAGRDYASLNKIAVLLDRLAKQAGGIPGKPIKVALLGSSTQDLLVPLLRAVGFGAGLSMSIYQPAYGIVRQEILNPESGLYTFGPDFVICASNWRDIGTELGEVGQRALSQRAELEDSWARIKHGTGATILQHLFDHPAYDAAGYLSRVNSSGVRRVIHNLNEALLTTETTGIIWVDCERLQAEAGMTTWADDSIWHVAKQHPAPEVLPLLAREYVTLIESSLGRIKKVLALDLDNTLWGGVIGEDGVAGIQIGAPSPVGEAHASLQRYILALKKRGVLLAVCSKNNHEDARAPFLTHDGMLLKLEDFVSFRANWEEKAVNIRTIAAELNLGLDSFVFLDDNPLERAKIRKALPEVSVVELPSDPAGYVRALDQGRYFESLVLSQDDLARHDAYIANRKRVELAGNTVDVGAFLRQLQMRMQTGACCGAVLERVTQLVNKTNQFNLTTKRYRAEQVVALAGDPDSWTCYFRLMDNLGDNGIIGIIFVVPSSGAWLIDTLLMSCRVMGRKAELFMLSRLMKEAKHRGIRKVIGVYTPTPKNGMVADFYPQNGFIRMQNDGDIGEQRFEADSFTWTGSSEVPITEL